MKVTKCFLLILWFENQDQWLWFALLQLGKCKEGNQFIFKETKFFLHSYKEIANKIRLSVTMVIHRHSLVDTLILNYVERKWYKYISNYLLLIIILPLSSMYVFPDIPYLPLYNACTVQIKSFLTIKRSAMRSITNVKKCKTSVDRCINFWYWL